MTEHSDRDGSFSAPARMLENRLRKRYKHLRKWARRANVSCYRLYDRDIPELPLTIDLYTAEDDTRHLSIARYQRESAESAESAESEGSGSDHETDQRDGWSAAMATAAARAVAPNAPRAVRVHLRERRRQRGLSQYQRAGENATEFVVMEGGHRFAINLDDYLDTGLFLDHRPLRARIEREAAGRRLLNLFCYTASISVYAARGGAIGTVSVDLSNRYLAWAERNFALNDIDDKAHQLVRADVFRYLQDVERGRFDIAVLDPPTFSNSKKMHRVLDIQRDHGQLIEQAMHALRPGGTLYFSTNYRRFKLEPRRFTGVVVSDIEDISQHTIPEDFRNRRIHRCWRMVKGTR